MLFNITLEMAVRKTQNKYGGLNLEENRRQCGILERRVLRRIFGLKINDITKKYEKRSNIEMLQLDKEPDIIVLKYRRMACANHVWRSNNLMKAVLKWKPWGERSLSRPKRRWIDQVEENLAEIRIRDGETIATGWTNKSKLVS
jgi:hypothetical protein